MRPSVLEIWLSMSSVVVCGVGCRPAGGEDVDAPTTDASKGAAPTPLDRRKPPTSESIANVRDAPHPMDAQETFCGRPVHAFDLDPTVASKTVGELLATTPVVLIVEPELSQSDCSGIGHMHFSYVPARQNPDGFERAYRSVPLPVAQHPPDASYYLLGGRQTPAHTVELSHVCIAFTNTVDLEVDWVLPIEDPDSVAEQLRAGACGAEP